MALASIKTFAATPGQTDFVFTPPYLAQSDVYVFIDDILTTAYTWLNSNTIRLNSGLAGGESVVIKRITDRSPLSSFAFGTTPSTAQANLILLRVQYIAQEVGDQIEVGALQQLGSGNYDATSNRIINLANGTGVNDAVNLGQLNTKQPLDATLTALAGITVAADKLIYATGVDSFSVTDITAAARNLIGGVAGAIDSFLPSQTGNSGKFLTTNGSASSWVVAPGTGTVTSIDGGRGVKTSTGSAITTSGTLYADCPVTTNTSGPVNISDSDRGRIFAATSGTFTYNLPAAAAVGSGWYCRIANTTAGTITVDGNASETINGNLTIQLFSNEGAIFVSDGTNFHMISTSLPDNKVSTAKLQAAAVTEAKLESGLQGKGYIVIEDRKAAATLAGTFTSGAWRTRDLNTKAIDTTGIATLSSNQITLPAGTYRVRTFAPAFGVSHHRSRFYNVTDAVSVADSLSMYADVTNLGNNLSQTESRFTIASPKVFELQHICSSTRASNGFGTGNGVGGDEIYSRVSLVKEA